MSKARRWGAGVSEAAASGEAGALEGGRWPGGTAGRCGRVAGGAGGGSAAAAGGASWGVRASGGPIRFRFRISVPVISPCKSSSWKI
jgi:hypothetical protein